MKIQRHLAACSSNLSLHFSSDAEICVADCLAENHAVSSKLGLIRSPPPTRPPLTFCATRTIHTLYLFHTPCFLEQYLSASNTFQSLLINACYLPLIPNHYFWDPFLSLNQPDPSIRSTTQITNATDLAPLMAASRRRARISRKLQRNPSLQSKSSFCINTTWLSTLWKGVSNSLPHLLLGQNQDTEPIKSQKSQLRKNQAAERRPAKMQTWKQEWASVRKTYKEAQPHVKKVSNKLQMAMGFEKISYTPSGDLVVIPWHMPLPAELQGQQIVNHPSNTLPESNASMVLCEEPIVQPFSPMPVRSTGRKRAQPSNLLERNLHNKHLAQQLDDFESNKLSVAPLQAKDVNLPILLSKPAEALKKVGETTNQQLKRKFSKFKLSGSGGDNENQRADLVMSKSVMEPLPKIPDMPLPSSAGLPSIGAVVRANSEPVGRVSGEQMKTNTSVLSSRQPRRRTRVSAEGDKTSIFEPSPPRHRPMPPISAILAHGFSDLSLTAPDIPRSHAWNPWTKMSMTHKTLSPTPAFLQHDTSINNSVGQDGQYPPWWSSSLPETLALHFQNPCVLIEEQQVYSLTLFLAPEKKHNPTLASTENRKKARSSGQTHIYEGPETGVAVRVIRMILPPPLPTTQKASKDKGQDPPHTDWLLLNLTALSTTPARITRSMATTTQPQQQAYTLLAIPTAAITDTTTTPLQTSTAETPVMETSTLRFQGEGRVPLCFGVGRNVPFLEKWVQGFGDGKAGVEVLGQVGKGVWG